MASRSHLGPSSRTNPPAAPQRPRRFPPSQTPRLPPPPTDAQLRATNSFYAAALRTGSIHGSTSSSTLHSNPPSRRLASATAAQRSTEDLRSTSRARSQTQNQTRNKETSTGSGSRASSRREADRGAWDEETVVHEDEDREIVKRDANGEYETFLTPPGDILALAGVRNMEDIVGVLDPVDMSTIKPNAGGGVVKEREQQLMDLWRSRKGQQIDLAEMHAANMAYLLEKTKALDEDNWMYEAEDPLTEQIR